MSENLSAKNHELIQDVDLSSENSILIFPNEILLHIFGFLDINDQKNVTKTCKK